MNVRLSKTNLSALLSLFQKRYGDVKISKIKSELTKDKELDGCELTA